MLLVVLEHERRVSGSFIREPDSSTPSITNQAKDSSSSLEGLLDISYVAYPHDHVLRATAGR